jgi:hypothetical protein
MAVNNNLTRVAAAVLGCVLLVVSVVDRHPPSNSAEVTINGPETTGIGEILEYEAVVKNTNNELITQWDVVKDDQPANYKVIGNSILIGSGAKSGKVLIIFNGAVLSRRYVFWTNVEKIPPVFKLVTINGTPEPPPVPDPTPIPAPMDGKYGIASLVYKTYNNFLTGSNRVSLATALAKNYNTVADSITNGELSTVAAIFKKLKDLNSPIVQSFPDLSGPYLDYDKIIQNYIYQLFTNNKLGPVEDYAGLLNEIAGGLKAVK